VAARFAGRRAAPFVATLVLLAGAAGCSIGSSGSSSGQLTPGIVNRYVLAQEAEGNLTRVINVVASADGTTQQLGTTPPGSKAYHNLVSGAQSGWEGVLVTLNAFTAAQGKAFPAVTTAVQQMHLVANRWLNTLSPLSQHSPATKRASQKTLYQAIKYETSKRQLLNDAARELSKETCSLGNTYRQLATAKDVVAACAAAKQLAPPAT
jgi:hypothetical protein